MGRKTNTQAVLVRWVHFKKKMTEQRIFETNQKNNLWISWKEQGNVFFLVFSIFNGCKWDFQNVTYENYLRTNTSMFPWSNVLLFTPFNPFWHKAGIVNLRVKMKTIKLLSYCLQMTYVMKLWVFARQNNFWHTIVRTLGYTPWLNVWISNMCIYHLQYVCCPNLCC